MKTDLELIADFRRGDQRAFEELISRYSEKAFSLARRLTRSDEDAEEVLQDVFVTVYRKVARFEGKSSFSSWLYRVTVNASLMKLRKRRNSRSVSSEERAPEVEAALREESMGRDGLDALAMRNQYSNAIEQAIGRLPEEYRPVFVLRDIDGLSSREVSKILKLSVPAVKSRLHRSRMLLRKKLLPLYREISEETEARRNVGNG